MLSALSIAVTVSGIVALLFAHATLAASQFGESAGSANLNLFDVGFASKNAREDQVLLIVTIMLVALAAVNAIFITQATVQDTRHTSAVTRALGATPQQVTAGLSAAQILPAVAGAVVGIPGGFALFAVASQGGSASQPPAWWLICRGARDRDRRGGAHLHPGPHRRAPSRGRDPSIRDRLIPAAQDRRGVLVAAEVC